jgi:hypothetical protein
MKNSKIALNHCSFEEMKSNAVRILNSEALVEDVRASKLTWPVFALTGPAPGPVVFRNCTAVDIENIGASVRDWSSAIFENCRIANATGDAFSISGNSDAQFVDCTVEECAGFAFVVYNGARSTIENADIKGCGGEIECFLEGAVNLKRMTGTCHHHDARKGSGCVKCRGQAGLICVPCCHALCTECKAAVETAGECPICRMKCEAVIPVFGSGVCMLCLDEEPTVVIQPCGHKCLCEECSKQLYQAGDIRCPMCMGKDCGMREAIGVIEYEKYVVEVEEDDDDLEIRESIDVRRYM